MGLIVITSTDSAEDANAAWSFLRTGHIVAHVREADGRYIVEVDESVVQRAVSLMEARTSIQEGRLPERRPPWYADIEGWGIVLLVVPALVLAAFPMVVMLGAVGMAMGILGPLFILVGVVMIPGILYNDLGREGRVRSKRPTDQITETADFSVSLHQHWVKKFWTRKRRDSSED